MSRTIGHDYREYDGWRAIMQMKQDRKYGKRQHVKRILRESYPALRNTSFKK